jgi:hypothetical protein
MNPRALPMENREIIMGVDWAKPDDLSLMIVEKIKLNSKTFYTEYLIYKQPHIPCGECLMINCNDCQEEFETWPELNEAVVENTFFNALKKETIKCTHQNITIHMQMGSTGRDGG